MWLYADGHMRLRKSKKFVKNIYEYAIINIIVIFNNKGIFLKIVFRA